MQISIARKIFEAALAALLLVVGLAAFAAPQAYADELKITYRFNATNTFCENAASTVIINGVSVEITGEYTVDDLELEGFVFQGWTPTYNSNDEVAELVSKGFAATTDDGWTYTVSGAEATTCTLTKYAGTDTEVVVPATCGGYPVGGIASSCFRYNNTMTSLSFAEGSTITLLSDNFCNSCTALKSVDVPASVTTIGNYFCSSCTSLTAITGGEGVLQVGDYLCYGCTSLASFSAFPNMQSLGNSAFRTNCNSLTYVYLPASLTNIGRSFGNNYITELYIMAPGSELSITGSDLYVSFSGTIYVADEAAAATVKAHESSQAYKIEVLPDGYAILSTEASSLKVGQTFTVELSLSPAFAAAQGKLSWSDNLKLVKVEAGNALAFAAGEDGFEWVDDEGADAHMISYVGNTATEAGVVAVATFECVAAGDATVGIESVMAGQSVDAMEYNLKASEPVELSIALDALKGDLNNSNTVNIVDAQIAYDLAAGKYAVESAAAAKAALVACWSEQGATYDMIVALADVNGDEALDSSDAFAIQYAVHHYGTFAA